MPPNTNLLDIIKNLTPRDLLLYVGIILTGIAMNRIDNSFLEGIILFAFAVLCFIISSVSKLQNHEEVKQKIADVKEVAKDANTTAKVAENKATEALAAATPPTEQPAENSL